jgi:hypothetical protein
MTETTTIQFSRPRLPLALGGELLCILLLAGRAHALGDDTPHTPTCPQGEIRNSKAEKCERR